MTWTPETSDILTVRWTPLATHEPEKRSMLVVRSAPRALAVRIEWPEGRAETITAAALVVAPSLGAAPIATLAASVSGDPPELRWTSAQLASLPAGLAVFWIQATAGGWTGMLVLGIVTVV